MNAEQALKITVNAIKVDAVLMGEEVNLNRVTFWLSELSNGVKRMGQTDVSRAGSNDIVRTAASISEQHHTAAQLVELAKA